jgi:hypothetical protein
VNLVVRCVEFDLATCKRIKNHPSRAVGRVIVPVAASTINKSAVITEKRRTEALRTVLVGHRLIRGEMRIAPTH